MISLPVRDFIHHHVNKFQYSNYSIQFKFFHHFSDRKKKGLDSEVKNRQNCYVSCLKFPIKDQPINQSSNIRSSPTFTKTRLSKTCSQVPLVHIMNSNRTIVDDDLTNDVEALLLLRVYDVIQTTRLSFHFRCLLPRRNDNIFTAELASFI